MSGKKKIDVNSDVGESFGNYTLGMDEELVPLISSANIACGYHAGDPQVMNRTMALARKHGVGAGAHPGLPDLIGFGRRFMDAGLDEIKDYVTYQVGALQAFARRNQVRLQHVKPHGALYNMAVRNPDIWNVVAEAMAELDNRMILFVLAGPGRGQVEAIGGRHGIRIAFEFFADRAYYADGSLVSRKEAGAVIHDQRLAAERVLKMVSEGRVTCLDGTETELAADTICVHGDNPAALKLVRIIRETLSGAGVEIVPVGRFL